MPRNDDLFYACVYTASVNNYGHLSTMQIKNTKFITSFANPAEYSKHEYPHEFCFCGRSNVGKSTLINTLCGAKIARTSQTPGRTRLINIFDCNNGLFTLVDLPGYGYAKASESERVSWQSLAEGYFNASKTLRRIFVLVDVRVHSPLDKQMLEYLYYFQKPFSILATKCDKIKRSQLPKAVIDMAAFLNVGRDDIIAVSQEGMGKDKVLSVINNNL